MSKLVINTGTTPNDGTGDSLFAGAGKINSNFTEIYTSIGDGTTLGIASFSQVNVSGASTFAGITTVSGVTLFARQLSVSGVSTHVGISTFQSTLFTNQFSASGVSTFAGITTVTGVSLFARQLSVAGVLTATSLIGQVNSGVGTITTLGGTNATYTTGNFTTGNIVTGVVTNISGTNINYTGIATVGSFNIGATQVISAARQLQNIASLDATTTATIESAIANAPNTFTDINVSGLSTFAGITTVTGVTLFSKQLDVAGVSTFAGITTVTGVSLFSRQLSVSGVSTFAGITTVTGETLFSRQLSVSGVSTLGTLRVVSGIVTATSGIITYYGDGSKLTGISAGGIGTQWVTNSSGIHTFANVGLGTNDPLTALYLDGVIGFRNSNIRIGSNQTLSGATGSSNIAIGDFAGISVNAGTRNVLIGDYSNAFGLDGSYNVMVGYRGSSQGSHNIHIGEYITGGTGNNNIVIGNGDFTNTYNFGAPDPSKDLQFAVGVNTTGNDPSNSKYWLVGNEQFNVGFGTNNPTSKVHVVGNALITGIATVGLANTSTPPNNSQLSFELISNTQLRIKVRGTDGVLRSADITLA